MSTSAPALLLELDDGFAAVFGSGRGGGQERSELTQPNGPAYDALGKLLGRLDEIDEGRAWNLNRWRPDPISRALAEGAVRVAGLQDTLAWAHEIVAAHPSFPGVDWKVRDAVREALLATLVHSALDKRSARTLMGGWRRMFS